MKKIFKIQKKKNKKENKAYRIIKTNTKFKI